MSELKINLPEFSAINVGEVEASVERLIAQCEAVIEKVATIESPTWDNFVQPQEEAQCELSNYFSPVSHLNSVMNTPELRDAYNACVPKFSAFYTRVGQNVDLYNATKRLRDSEHYITLSDAQKKSIENDLRGFRLSGVSLDADKKKQFGKLAEQLATATSQFSDNVLDATNAWEKLITDPADLKGLPESAMAAAKQRAEQKDQQGWHLNLEFPTVYAVMTFCENRDLRKEVYIANGTRASNLGPQAGQFDNSELMQSILRMRAEQASLLDFANYAEYSVVTKMVESPKQVTDFLNDLATRAVPMAKQELEELEQFAKESLGIETLEAWDLGFAGDKLKQKLYDISDEDLKPYFPASKAIPGMFNVVGKLFGLDITPVIDVDIYQTDVSCYQIHDSAGELRGMFYLDNYARENKRGGAWMDVCRSRQKVSAAVQLPVAYLTCNLTPPVGDDPALLT
ncbi:MAG: M3 family metallopeptidase, partial [Gammaproteobacteria bacterium]|nr:M3 family metallopeptidase [Gammaproteobacteria bacterium]